MQFRVLVLTAHAAYLARRPRIHDLVQVWSDVQELPGRFQSLHSLLYVHHARILRALEAGGQAGGRAGMCKWAEGRRAGRRAG